MSVLSFYFCFYKTGIAWSNYWCNTQVQLPCCVLLAFVGIGLKLKANVVASKCSRGA